MSHVCVHLLSCLNSETAWSFLSTLQQFSEGWRCSHPCWYLKCWCSCNTAKQKLQHVSCVCWTFNEPELSICLQRDSDHLCIHNWEAQFSTGYTRWSHPHHKLQNPRLLCRSQESDRRLGHRCADWCHEGCWYQSANAVSDRSSSQAFAQVTCKQVEDIVWNLLVPHKSSAKHILWTFKSVEKIWLQQLQC